MGKPLIGAMAMAFAAWSTPAMAVDQTLLLDVRINGRQSQKVGEFILRDGRLFATRTDLRDLGFRVASIGQSDLMPLSELTRLKWRIDQTTQTLHVDAPDETLLPTIVGARSRVDDELTLESGIGAALDYQFSAVTGGGGSWSASGLIDFRIFSPAGLVTSGVLVSAGDHSRRNSGPIAIRLDTTYSFTDSNSLRRYRAGDFIADGLGSSRAVRMGGLQITSDFSTRPDLITFPLPELTGSAAVPSTLDVLVNGSRLLSAELAPGPFEVPQLPIVTGRGTIALVLTDFAGRRVVTNIPVYASRTLLARGLQTYSVQIGALRRRWGVSSNDYGQFAATASFRRGLTSRLTTEAVVEVTRGNVMASGGLAFNFVNQAQFVLTAAASEGDGKSGYLLSAGMERIGSRISLSGSVALASRAYRDLAATSGDRVPQLRASASVGLSLGRIGNWNMAYAGIAHRPADERGTSSWQATSRAHIISSTWSAQYGSIAAHATGFRNFSDSRSHGLSAGISFPFGRRGSAGASISGGPAGRRAQFHSSRAVNANGGWGYHAFETAGKDRHAFVLAQYQAPAALFGGGISRSGSAITLRGEIQGSIALLGGKLALANRLHDSFALVDTSGVGNVRVLHENQVIGRTNREGRLLVPNLRAFELNQLAIDPDDVPADTNVPFVRRTVRPMERSGVVIRFPLRTSHAGLLKLIDEAGRPLALGSVVMAQLDREAVPVGYDGEAFVENLAADNAILVELVDGRRCKARFAYRSQAGEIPVIGPVRCEMNP